MILFIENSRAAAAADLGIVGDKVTMRGVRASRPSTEIGLMGISRGIGCLLYHRWLGLLHHKRARAPAPHERFACYTFF